MAWITPIQVGARYHRWKVLKETPEGWLCVCNCGTERTLSAGQVRKVKSCGCANRYSSKNSRSAKIKPEQKFNRWTVIGPSKKEHNHTLWPCRCVCGTEAWVAAYALTKGSSQSCGCIRREMGRRIGIPQSKDLPQGLCDKHQNMQTCDNCNTEFDADKEGLVTMSKGRPACSICDGCLEGSRTIKLVLRRGDVGGFVYEQYATLEALKGGLTSPRRAG